MCVLCKDTFSRSDILKRHFQKCSLRRGNPTGASHLSHPQAHLKRSQAAANAAKPVQDEVSSSIPPSNGLVGTTFGEGAVNGNGLATSRPGFTDQQPLGFSMSSVNGMNRGQPDDAFSPGQGHQRASWTAAPKQNPYLVQPGTEAPSQQLNVDLPPIEQAKPPVVQDPKRPVMPGPHPNHPGDIDWTSMFQPGAHDGYINPVFPHSMAPGHEPINAHVESERKYYPTTTGGPTQEGGLNGLYLASTSLGGDGMLASYFSPSYLTRNDPLRRRMDRLVDYRFSTGLQVPFNLRDNNVTLKECPTADNVKHFFDLFTNYQGHWFCMHMSSFAFLRAYDDLITAISCVGAVYSNRTDLSQVQGLVKLSEAAIERTSRVQRLLRTGLAVNREQTANATHLSEGFTGGLGPVDRTCLEVASGSRLCSDVGLLARLVCRFVLPIGLQVAGTGVSTAISTLRRMISQFGTG